MKKIKEQNSYAKETIEKLNLLENEIFNGKIELLEEDRFAKDVNEWNIEIEKHLGQTWFEVPFYWCEAYFYRRILQAISYFETQKDPFEVQKHQETKSSAKLLVSFSIVPNYLPYKLSIEILLKFKLWGNRADMSQNDGDRRSVTKSTDDNILIDDIPKATTLLENVNQIDIILDNAGAELLADLVFVEYLLRINTKLKIVLHTKATPLFVSDAMTKDVYYTINFFAEQKNELTRQAGLNLKNFLDDNRLQVKEHIFWSLPKHFTEFPQEIISQLNETDLLISKGDANYRRFLEDRKWQYTKKIEEIVDYMPVPYLLVRTLKSEILVGIDKAKLQEVQHETGWLTSGKYGIIHLVR